MSETPEQQPDSDVVWSSRVDLDVWEVTVRRVTPEHSELSLTLVDTGEVVHRQAVFVPKSMTSPDLDIINEWQRAGLAVIDHPERRNP